MRRLLHAQKLHVTHWFLLAVLGAASAGACGNSEKGSSASGGKSGSAGSSGKGGAGGTAGKSGTGGKAGGSSSGGRAGSGGKGGAGKGGGGDAASGGDAGEPGSGGRAGGAQGGNGGGAAAGQAGEGGEGGAPSGGVDGTTCLDILANDSSAADGVYTVDPDGAAGDPPVDVVCDMTTEGGGWTLGLLKNSLDAGHYADFASGRVNPAALATTPAAASADTGAVALAGWLDLNAFPYTNLELAGYRSGAETYRSQPIPKSALRIPFGTDGYYLYDQVDGYYWCGGTNEYTTDGVGQVMQPNGAPDDCKGHTSLGDGWDFGTTAANAGLTVCGGGSTLMTTHPGSGYLGYGSPGGAQAFWVR